MSGEATRVTRRAVIRGAAVAGAAALIDPTLGLARAEPRGVFSRYVGTVEGESRALEAPGRFALVGVEWRAPARARIELRTRLRGEGGWGPWVLASVQGHGPDGTSASARRFGEPIWTGPNDYVQLRTDVAVSGVRLHFVAAAPGAPGPHAATAAGAPGPHAATAAAALPLAQPVLDAGPGQPPIIAREAWARGHAPPRHLPEYGTVKLAFVHHSETPNGYGPGQVPSILSSIFVYHRYVRDYFDIGYNFAVDAYGRIWEARAGGVDQAVMGAHAGGYNTESTGVVVLGSFTGVSPPPVALSALERLLAWKLAMHGVPALGRVSVEVSPAGAGYTAYAPGSHVSLPRIAGHRDGDQTSCPGDALYARLPSVRPRVAALTGSALRLSIAAPVPPVSPGTSVTVTGRLTELSGGAPLAGAPIEFQQLTGTHDETTIATLITDSDGAWSFSVTPAANTLLRALHRPAPAAVSDVVVIAVAPVVTLSLVSSAPLVVSGTVNPAGPRVTIDLYRGRRLVASKTVAAPGGNFQARVKRPPPGRYRLVARTASSARYAAGTSAPVSVIV
jgi:hypothetical protein